MALGHNPTAGPGPPDQTSRMDPFVPMTAEMSELRPPRIGFIRSHFIEKADDDMRDAMERAAAQLRAAGAEVIDVDLPEGFAAVWPAWKIVAAAERTAFHAKHAAALQTAGVELKPDVDAFVPATYYLQ